MRVQTLRCEWFPASSPSPKLLVVLHGRGDSSEGFHWLPEALNLPGVNYLLVNAPDRYFPGYSWYPLPPDQGPGVLRSRHLLDALFEEVAQAGYLPEDTALFGFSQGCLMTLEWGGRTELPLAAYVGVSGYCLDAEALLSELAPQARRPVWLVTHGTHDGVLPFEISAQQVKTLQDGGWEIQFEAYAKDHTVDPYDELPTIREFLAERLMPIPARCNTEGG